ncbi:protein hupE [Stutzerimonas stutzeri]|uniref:HupE/UreJ family protein n=1 Tax=Stutzerimonas stutzeri TaxID=316 RepID=UPI0024A0C464|nr:HupE/UreJ family protein [Stutzerimonas stutzeri]GLZ24118.1 protein hupE [Stutzerimonas stutzeri]
MKTSRKLATVILAAALPGIASAHTGLGAIGGLASGFSHPLFGADHLLAMLAVGVWARQQGGGAVWVIPAAFIGAMLLGGALALEGIGLPFVERGIGVSVVLLGLLVATALRLPTVVGAALVGLFAILHGHAHGSEMPLAASAFTYAAGFVVATALLHGLGVALADLARRGPVQVIRAAGAGVALSGALLAFA